NRRAFNTSVNEGSYPMIVFHNPFEYLRQMLDRSYQDSSTSRLGILQHKSEGNCYDNTPSGSFFSSLGSIYLECKLLDSVVGNCVLVSKHEASTFAIVG